VFLDEVGCYRGLACAYTCFRSGGAGRGRGEELASAQSDEHGCQYPKMLRRYYTAVFGGYRVQRTGDAASSAAAAAGTRS
jgi:hypothetical protein